MTRTRKTESKEKLCAKQWQEISNFQIIIQSCDYLIIGDFNNGKEKKGIFLTSRVHPGETMASYIIEYIIDFITGNTVEARILRENFIFKIVPMLNIDGVINGNYR
jgi:murein tripeptide amidase MpaA